MSDDHRKVYTREEFAEMADLPVPSLEDALHAALSDVFNIPHPLATGFGTSVLVDGDDDLGHASVMTNGGLVAEVRYEKLRYYSGFGQADGWVLTGLTIDDLHDDPVQFEGR